MAGMDELVSSAALQIYEYGLHTRDVMVAEGRCLPFYVMSYIQEGEALLRTEGVEHVLPPRSVTLIPPGVTHDHIKRGGAVAVFMWWHFDYKLYGILDVLKLLRLPLVFTLSEAAEFEDAFARYMAVMGGPITLQNSILKRALAMEIMAQLLGAAEEARRGEVSLGIPASFQQMLDMIVSGRHGPLRLGELAEQFNMHPTYLSNRFKRYYGVAPIALHRKVLLRRAQDMLSVEGVSVSEVAESLGFNSASVFSRFFSSKLGVPPSRITRKSGGVERL